VTWSLQVRHGDLTLGGAQLGVVTDEQKLVQDLSHWLLERLGSDPLHPEHGSLIDGGVQNGRVVNGVIGEDDWAFAEVLIESDIRRIVAEYQAQQLQRAKDDRLRYNKATLTAAEVVMNLDEVEMVRTLAQVTVTLFLSTAAGKSVTLDVALPAS
jgi:hypothetical protein